MLLLVVFIINLNVVVARHSGTRHSYKKNSLLLLLLKIVGLALHSIPCIHMSCKWIPTLAILIIVYFSLFIAPVSLVKSVHVCWCVCCSLHRYSSSFHSHIFFYKICPIIVSTLFFFAECKYQEIVIYRNVIWCERNYAVSSCFFFRK